MAKSQVQTRIDEVRKLDTKEFHKLFTAPKSRILMLLEFLEKGGDLKEMAENVPNNRKKKYHWNIDDKDLKDLMA
jgi:hypothetical protein